MDDRLKAIDRIVRSIAPHTPGVWAAVAAAYDAGAAAERNRLAQRLQTESELDGFGCACTPQRVCGTCTARDTISKALTPLMRELGA